MSRAAHFVVQQVYLSKRTPLGGRHFRVGPGRDISPVSARRESGRSSLSALDEHANFSLNPAAAEWRCAL